MKQEVAKQRHPMYILKKTLITEMIILPIQIQSINISTSRKNHWQKGYKKKAIHLIKFKSLGIEIVHLLPIKKFITTTK
jgi:pullulanase/glycogen debranching enzyme